MGPVKRIAGGVREAKICGVAACRALFEQRFEDVIRISLLDEMVREFSPILKRCAAERKAYHIVSPEELAKISETAHSEGICVLAKAKPLKSFSAFLASLPEAQARSERLKQAKKAQAIIVLEGVRNPHNLGAILRVCAHFGAEAVVYDPADHSGGISTAVYRTAEGGVESLTLVPESDLVMAVKEMKKKGLKAFATSGRAKVSLYENGFSPRALILLGSEAEGLSPALLRTADEVLQIPGTEQVESLNVACAAAVALGEFWREHKQPAKK